MNLGNNRGKFGLNMPSASLDQTSGDNVRLFNAAHGMAPAEQVKKAESQARFPSRVEFPPHLFIPEGAESLDIRKVMNVPTGTVDYSLIRFTAPPGAVTRFIAYGIYNDGDAAANYEFKPLINGNRVFRYHGEPISDTYYKIALGLGPDLSNASLINCQITMEPGMFFDWLITNTSGVDTSMGVRMAGYFDTQQKRVTPKFG